MLVCLYDVGAGGGVAWLRVVSGCPSVGCRTS
jgi:hypothetical protein